MREEIVNFGDKASLIGIWTPKEKNVEEENDTCVIFLNAGLIHKVGPNRLYVKLARTYAQTGLCCFRFDFSGLGDSELNSEETDDEDIRISEIKQAMDWIQENKDIDKFILMGICSGAENAFHASPGDSRIIGLSLIDGVYPDKLSLKDIYFLADRSSKMRYYKKHAFSLRRWIKIISGKSNLFTVKNFAIALALFRTVIKKTIKIGQKQLSAKADNSSLNTSAEFDIEHWKRLFERGVKIHLIFCEGGVALDIYRLTISRQLKEYGMDDLLKTEIIKDVDHTFTPIWSQEYLVNLTCEWIKQVNKANLSEVPEML